MSALTPRWTRETMLERQQYWKERTLERQRRHHQYHLEFQAILDSIYKFPSKQAELNAMTEYREWERKFELAEQANKENPTSLPSEPCQNMPTPDKPLVSVPTSVEELGTPLELAEQDEQDLNEEKIVSPASEPCLNMASPDFAGEQADSVPPSVEQLGNCDPKPSTPKIRPYHVPDSATHMAPAKSPADVVPSRVLIMDFRNLQFRRHVKHLVDHTDVASMGGNTNTSAYSYSS